MHPPPTPGSAPSTLSPGSRLGKYEILHQLGSGGMGKVYRARDSHLGREVAIKTVALESRSAKDALARFEQEARSASALNHPNIVTIYELGHVDGMHYIAMELVSGETLRELLVGGAVPFRKAIAIAAQIADALARVHEIGVIHRDLKPENLMVSREGTAKILDFGLSKLFATDQHPGRELSTVAAAHTEHGMVMGTIGYMSPEQASGAPLDFRSDQFSFGSVLHEMVTGRAAFRRNSRAETMAAILRDEPERADSKLREIPAPFFWIVERCLAKDPEKRYASTRDLARDLATVRDRLAAAPIRRSESHISNLPVQRTPIIGREQEAAALRDLLRCDDVRLVTLTGPGGIGKTRLALNVAGEIGDQFPGGVCFVALSSIPDLNLIASAIAQAVGLRESGNQSSQESLKNYIARLEEPLLLLLDNFEHVVSAGPEVAQLLTIGPKLKVMITSQAPLHLYGEHEFPVPPLAVPPLKSIPPLDVLASLPAIALFVERARAVKPEFALTKENASAVTAICARLDGLPLAIELAAARVKMLSPSAMLTRLESSLQLLTGGARDLPVRQQTLRGTVDWSYGLLNTAEQTLFRRLSVFVGGCTLEGVEAVCDTKGDLGFDVLDGMASMVDKSLARQADEIATEARFRMLSTIREYAAERLAASGDESASRRAHAAYYLVLAEEGAEYAGSPPEWLDRFEVEHDNFRSALDYLIETGDADWGLRLGLALFRFWETREYLTEGRTRIARLLDLKGSAGHPKLRARLLFAAAVLAGDQADYVSAQQLFESSLETCIELGDTPGVAVALNALSVNARERGDLDRACFLVERCVAIWKDLGAPADIARALSNLANLAKMKGEYDRASSLYDECVTLFREAGDRAGVAWTLNYQGDVARDTADVVAARQFYEQSLATFREMQDGWGIANALSDLGTLSRDEGNHVEARRLYGESIKTFQDLDHKRGVARVLGCLAASAAAQGKAEQALRFAGAAAGLRQRIGVPLAAVHQSRLEKALEPARLMLSNDAGLAAWVEGWGMPVERAVQEALGSENV